MRCKVVLSIILSSVAVVASGQTIQEADKHISELFDRISYWQAQSATDTAWPDSADEANYKLDQYLRATATKLPITSHFPLSEKNGLNVVVSPDHKMKVYSWDSWLGGSMHRYNSLAAFQTPKGIKTTDILNLSDSAQSNGGTNYSEGGYLFDGLSVIKANDQTATYLLWGSSVESTSERGALVIALKIVNNELVNIPFFKTTTRTVNFISYSYDAFASQRKDATPAIHLSADKKKLFIPIVNGPYHNKLSGKYLVYRFDGERFVFDPHAK